MPSSIPQYYEGGPARQDNFFVTMLVSGTVSVGNAVTLTSTPYTVATTTTDTNFFFGVVITTGALAGTAADVQVRGIVDAIADGAITAGAFVILSDTTAGQVEMVSGGELNNRAVALSTATNPGDKIQIMLY